MEGKMAKATQRPGSLNLQGFKRFVETKVQPDLRPIAIKFWQPAAREASELTPGMRGGTEKYIPVPVRRLKRDVMVLSLSPRGADNLVCQRCLVR